MSLTIAPSRKILQSPVTVDAGPTPTWEINVPASGWLQVSMQIVCVGPDGRSPMPMYVRLETAAAVGLTDFSYFAGSVDVRIVEGEVTSGDLVFVSAAPVFTDAGFCWVDEVAAFVSDESLGDVVPVSDFGPVWLVFPFGNGVNTVGDTASVTASALGSPSPSVTYQWQCDMVDIAGATSATFVVPGTAIGKQLDCVVTATGATVITQRVGFGVVPSDLAAPGYPFGFAAVPTGFEFGVQMTWDTPVADPGVPAADSFQIRYRQQGAASWIVVNVPDDPSTTSSTSVNAAASHGQTWEYSVRFVNSTGEGPWADEIAVTFAPFFATADGGYFETADGGYFITDGT